MKANEQHLVAQCSWEVEKGSKMAPNQTGLLTQEQSQGGDEISRCLVPGITEPRWLWLWPYRIECVGCPYVSAKFTQCCVLVTEGKQFTEFYTEFQSLPRLLSILLGMYLHTLKLCQGHQCWWKHCIPVPDSVSEARFTEVAVILKA